MDGTNDIQTQYEEVKKQGKKIDTDTALEIANKVYEIINTEGKKNIHDALFVDTSTGWKYIQKEVEEWLSTESHVLINIIENGKSGHARIIIGKEVDIEKLCELPKLIKRNDNDTYSSYWIIDLSV